MKEREKLFLKRVILKVSCWITPEWIAGLRQAGVEVSENLEDPRDPEVEDKDRNKDKNKDLDPLNETLWITDDPSLARDLAARGRAVLAILSEGGGDFSGVKYLCEGLEELDATYLDRVYRRYAGIPWDILETERCYLRETTEEDVDAFYEIYREPSITQYMEDLFPDRDQEIAYTRDYIRNVYEFYGFGVWTVCLKGTGQVIGRAGLSYREGFDEAELGFVIGLPWQRRGIAEEVCRAALSFGREELGFQTVIAFAEPENTVSVRLLKRLGFTPAGEEILRGLVHGMFRIRLSGETPARNSGFSATVIESHCTP